MNSLIRFVVFSFLTLAASSVMAFVPAPSASTISTTIDLNTVFTGNTPDGPAPWLTASFTSNVGLSTGTLTLQSLLSGSDFLQGANGVTGWAFYLSGNSVSSFSCTGTCADTVTTTPLDPPSGLGTFNYGFGWLSGNRFSGADSATYVLTFNSVLTANPFVANSDKWISVAHVQGITGGCSAYIVAGTGEVGQQDGPCVQSPPPNVPEPADLGLFGFGLVLIGLFIGLRKLRS